MRKERDQRMAKTGIEYVCVAELDEGGGTYTGGFHVGPSAKFAASPSTSTVKDFGDNRAVVTDTSVTTGTVSLEINEFGNKACAKILGHAYDQEKDAVTCNANDQAPYMGVGCIGRSTGAKRYKAVVYRKVKFKDPSDEYDTQQEQVSFAHTTLEGDFYTLEDGEYSVKAGFDTRDEAKSYIDKMFGIVASAETP